VLIGRPATNLWTGLYASKINFHIESDLASRRIICRNSAPQAGELAEYVSKVEGARVESFSTVAFMPNLNGGNVLLISGAAGSAQEGAGDFLTSDKLFTRLAEKIERDGRMPFFEALLHTVAIDGMSQEPSIVSYRVLPGH
jgi:hypothetical protein